MKVALLITGQYRNSFEEAKKMLEFFRSQREIKELDVFVHTWWDEEAKDMKGAVGGCILGDNPRDKIQETLQPKKILIQKQETVDFTGLPYYCEKDAPIWRDTRMFISISQILAMKHCINAVENIESYDLVIRIRPDLGFVNDNYDFQVNWQEMTKEGTISTVTGKFIDGWETIDVFYAGRPKEMLYFSNNYEAAYRQVWNVLKKQPHVFETVIVAISLLNLKQLNFMIPFVIKRDQNKNAQDQKELPYWYNLIPEERRKTHTLP